MSPATLTKIAFRVFWNGSGNLRRMNEAKMDGGEYDGAGT